jgi:hypothetical protein
VVNVDVVVGDAGAAESVDLVVGVLVNGRDAGRIRTAQRRKYRIAESLPS